MNKLKPELMLLKVFIEQEPLLFWSYELQT